MLIIKTNQPNSLVVTVSQNSELSNPEYLFSFTHIFSKQNVSFIPVDVSLHSSRYDEFYFVEGLECDEIHFPYEGQYLYSISEQPAGSGNLNPALAYNVVENGEAQIIVQSAITVNSQFDVFISSNEDNSNFIFAPDEPNPTPNITCSPTQTPGLPTATPTPSNTPTLTPTPSITPSITPTNTSTNTPTPSLTPTNTQTPSLTPTFTPTPSTTPQPDTPAALGALWWIDFTDAATLTLNGGNIQTATDKIANVVFSADPGGPMYNATGYLGVSGSVQTNATQLKNQGGDYSNVGEYTWFGFVYDDVVSQRGGKIFTAADNPGYPGGLIFSLMIDPNAFGYVWRFANKTSIGNQSELNIDITFSAWTAISMRSYNSGADTNFEVWENGSIISSGTAVGNVYVSTDPVFSLLFDGGIDFNTEQFFFDKKLTNGEMAAMFNYLNNKY